MTVFASSATGLPIGLGGAPLGNLYAAMPDAQAQAVLSAALNAGCRTLDTAPHYGNGLSEHRFGNALRGFPRDDLVLSSKVGRLLRPSQRAASDQNGYVDVLPFEQV